MGRDASGGARSDAYYRWIQTHVCARTFKRSHFVKPNFKDSVKSNSSTIHFINQKTKIAVYLVSFFI